MAEIIDLGSQVKVIRDALTINVYDKSGLSVAVDAGALILLDDGVEVERFARGVVTNPAGCSVKDLLTLVLAMLAAVPAAVTPGTGAQLKFCKTFSHSDFQTAALSNDIEIFKLPAAHVLTRVTIKHSTAFAGPDPDGGGPLVGITSYTISVGIAGELDRYASPFDVTTPPSDSNFQVSLNSDIPGWGAETSIRVNAVCTGDGLSASTTGSVFIVVTYEKEPC